ncbi:MAG: type I polyketide synthase [Pseudonocardiaceae bacterium]
MADRTPQQELLQQLLLEKYEPIAIVGMGLRFPGDNDTPSAFEEFLRAGRSGIVPTPEDRWDSSTFWSDTGDAPGKVRTVGGGFLSDIDQFDPKFFNISPKEADYIDPQQRLVLETAWTALEDADIDPTGLRGGNGAVYLGIGSMDYLLELDALEPEELDSHLGTGTAHSAVSGRLSYFLGWRGPCISVDTACSSSLVAVHLAVDGLRRRECDIALTGGVNAIHHPTASIVFSAAEMLAPDGQCKTFDDAADGYTRSEGCGILVLKRLSDAKRDGDTVLALVRGSAVRQDGESAGLTVPNGTAQEAVMRAALERAMLAPADIQYVEAHGTGTPLGDPIEMGSINDVFAGSHSSANPILVGSVKTNLGHMEIAAGVGGIIKTVLQLRAGTIYPHRNLHTPSSRIPWDSYPVSVPTECLPWPGGPRRALVNSFGFTGTIATAVLEQAPPGFDAAPDGDPLPAGGVFTLSAKSTRSLRRQIARYQQFLAEHPEQSIADLCYTSNVGRAHLPLRIAGAVRDRADLTALLETAQPEHGTAGEIRKVAFLFTGQGAQYPGMATALYRRYPVFRQHFDECDQLFKLRLGRSITPIVFGQTEDPGEIHQTRFTQPSLFAVEYATARLWLSWGVRPSALIGHSIGEIVAATVAGLFSLEDAITLVAARAQLMHSVSTPGRMVAVRATPQQVAPLLAGYPDLSVAAVNAPQQCVLSGGRQALTDVVAALSARNIRSTPLAVSQAFHSPLMAQVREPFREAIADIRYREPELTLISTLTGKVARFAELADPDYWVRQICAPVDFAAGMRTLEQRGQHACIELGPGAELTALGKRCVRAADHLWLPSTSRSDTDGATIRRALAQLYTAGLPVSWPGYHQGSTGRKIALPTYAFDRKRYWLPTSGSGHRRGAASLPERLHHPLLGSEIPAGDGVREFVAQFGPDQPGYLRDHVARGQLVVPGSAYLEILLALQDEVYGQTGRPIDDLCISQALLLRDDQLTEVRTRLCPHPDGHATVTIVSLIPGPDGPIERCHATATLGAQPRPELTDLAASLGTQAASAEQAGELGAEQLYARFVDLGMTYGPAFQLVRRVTTYGAGSLGGAGSLKEPLAIGEISSGRGAPGEQLPPPVLDCALQTVAALADTDEAYLPVRFGSCQLFRKPRGAQLRCLARLRAVEPDEFADADHAADLVLLDGDDPVFVLRGLGYKRVTDAVRARRVHEPRWVQRPARPADPGQRHVLLLGAEEFGRPTIGSGEAGCRLSFATGPDDAARLLAERPTDVCWFWRTDTTDTATTDVTATGLRAECERNYRDLLELLHRLDQAGFGRTQRLWLVTRGAQWIAGDGTADIRLAAATLWGFGQTLRTEYPAYQMRMVDLDASATDYQPLLAELPVAEPDESQLAYRRGRRYVRRLYPNQFLEDSTRPVGDQIQVRVHAVGLNYKDAMTSVGLIERETDGAGQPVPVGYECAGTVLAAGPHARYQPGEEVVVSSLGCLRPTLTVPSSVAARKPANLDFETAAGQATAYLNAYYALHRLAQLKPGDRVLIHAAAGGVGQAAVRLARLAGAEVYATASRSKWPFVRALGVTDVLDSRTLDFAEQLRAATGGRGVDVVFNGLNGEYIPAGLRALATGGRFVQLGKAGIWSAEEMRAARPDVRYHSYYLSDLPEEELRPLVGEILPTVVDLLATGQVPPVPTTSYPPEELDEALTVLRRGENVGKLVISLVGADAPVARPVRIRSDRTYLITGGLGALGLVAADHLVALGARRLALVSRRSFTEAEHAELQARFGPEVTVTGYAGDIGNATDVDRITAALRARPEPVGGIIHAAGVLADAPVATQTWDRIDTVFQAKVYGSWLLHQAAAAMPELEFFVGYSSIASVFGPPAQANYAAANAFLDTLMHWRAAQRLPGLSINWGPWSEAGMVAGLRADLIKNIENQGIRLLKPADGMRALTRMLDQPVAQALIGEFDWNRLVAGMPLATALYAEVTEPGGHPAPEVPPAQQVDLAALRTQPPAERVATITAVVRATIADALHFDPDDVEVDAQFVELGLDSLAAMALKNSLEATFGIPLAASITFDHPSIRLLARYLDQQLAPEA